MKGSDRDWGRGVVMKRGKRREFGGDWFLEMIQIVSVV